MRRCSVVLYILQLANKYLTISDPSGIGLGVRTATRTSSVGIGAKPDVGATNGRRTEARDVGDSLAYWRNVVVRAHARLHPFGRFILIQET